MSWRALNILCHYERVSFTEENIVMVNSEELIGATDYLMLEMRRHINWCHCKWVGLYILPKYWGEGGNIV